jgi:hypothetical protein
MFSDHNYKISFFLIALIPPFILLNDHLVRKDMDVNDVCLIYMFHQNK